MQANYKICSNCIMDSSDPNISFHENGMCNHCKTFYNETSKEWMPNEIGAMQLDEIIRKIKSKMKNKKYDCILGISGGVDSSYLALVLKKYNLRTLLVHVDAGWNKEVAVSNIQKVVEYTGFDLYTHVVDWEDMKKLQIAYLKSGISNQDVPQDHIFFSTLFKVAMKLGIKVFVSGGNFATECILPKSWHGSAMDAINLKDIYKKFGSSKLTNYDTINFFEYHFLYKILGMREVRPLNYMPYDRNKAIDELQQIGWRNYGRKHGESFFTNFFQNYYLPIRFQIDKRRAHYSSMIVTSQISREEALKLINEPLYNDQELANDYIYFCNKLSITPKEMENYMNLPIKSYSDYKNWDSLLKYVTFVRRIYNSIINY
jgi:N-acetyl sugar amidotransferase